MSWWDIHTAKSGKAGIELRRYRNYFGIISIRLLVCGDAITSYIFEPPPLSCWYICRHYDCLCFIALSSRHWLAVSAGPRLRWSRRVYNGTYLGCMTRWYEYDAPASLVAAIFSPLFRQLQRPHFRWRAFLRLKVATIEATYRFHGLSYRRRLTAEISLTKQRVTIALENHHFSLFSASDSAASFLSFRWFFSWCLYAFALSQLYTVTTFFGVVAFQHIFKRPLQASPLWDWPTVAIASRLSFSLHLQLRFSTETPLQYNDTTFFLGAAISFDISPFSPYTEAVQASFSILTSYISHATSILIYIKYIQYDIIYNIYAYFYAHGNTKMILFDYDTFSCILDCSIDFELLAAIPRANFTYNTYRIIMRLSFSGLPAGQLLATLRRFRLALRNTLPLVTNIHAIAILCFRFWPFMMRRISAFLMPLMLS